VAISQDDTTQSGTANITISTGANILSLHPASVFAGGANGFTLLVEGSGFVPSNPGPGSTLIIGGTMRVTTCLDVNHCAAPVTPNDVAQTLSMPVQIKDPDNSSSNVVSLIVVAPSSMDEVITLDASQPAVTGRDIVVVEPTTAALDSADMNLDMTVAAIGTFNTANAPCLRRGRSRHLSFFRSRIRYQHELHDFRKRRRRGHLQATCGTGNHPPHVADTVYCGCRSPNTFYPERESRSDGRYGRSGGAMRFRGGFQ